LTNACPPVAERDVTSIIYHYSLNLPASRQEEKDRKGEGEKGR
jgi:hypothetical protein